MMSCRRLHAEWTRRAAAGLFAAVLVVAAAGGAAAQAPRPGQQRGLDAPLPLPGDDLTPGEVQRLFTAYMIVQAQEMLRLSDAQYPEFVTRLRRLQENRLRHQQERQRLLRDLQQLSSGSGAGDEAAIRERLEALRDHERAAADAQREAYDAIDEILDMRQRARFRVFEEQMERRRLQLLMRAGRPRAPAPRRDPPPR